MTVHIVSATAIVGPDGPTGEGVYLALCGEQLGLWAEAIRGNPVGNYLGRSSPLVATVTCTDCRLAFGLPTCCDGWSTDGRVCQCVKAGA